VFLRESRPDSEETSLSFSARSALAGIVPPLAGPNKEADADVSKMLFDYRKAN
jgi:hypothetical protein